MLDSMTTLFCVVNRSNTEVFRPRNVRRQTVRYEEVCTGGAEILPVRRTQIDFIGKMLRSEVCERAGLFPDGFAR
jgi:hypothetical protein